MACKKSNFLGECPLHNHRTDWTDEDGICFVEEYKTNTCPNFEFISIADITSVVRKRNQNGQIR